MRKLSVMALIVLGAAACGADRDLSPGHDYTTDDGMWVEDVTSEPSDVPSEAYPDGCDRNLGSFVPPDKRAGLAPWDGVWTMQGSIGAGFYVYPFTLISLESWYLEADGPTAPGRFYIEERVSTESCGLCLFVSENCDEEAHCEHRYAADSGRVDILTLDTLAFGNPVAGLLTGAHLVEVDWDADEVIPGGLAFCLDEWVFAGRFTDIYTW